MGDLLTRLLTQDQPRFEIFRACVAFAKASGVLRLAPALQFFIDRGGRVEIVVGIDEGITTKQALELVMKYSTTAFVFNNPVTTFHPKVYLFEAPGKAVALIGSSNLTTGGLYTNYEANIGLELDLSANPDNAVYKHILSIFLNASDLTTGNAKLLEPSLLENLLNARKVIDETKQTRKRLVRKRETGIMLPLFPRLPIPPPPGISPDLAPLIPKVSQFIDVETEQEAVDGFQPWKTFVMILGTRDTRQKKGYSRDIYIPLAARDLDPDFWGWSEKFTIGASATVGNYLERRIPILIRPVIGEIQIIEDVRLYYYDIKHEFRLNCGRLIEGAKPGDLLVIQKSPIGTLFHEETYQYEATVLPPTYPAYQTYIRECRIQVEGSPKRWGYL
jgi:HKD family nuclease